MLPVKAVVDFVEVNCTLRIRVYGLYGAARVYVILHQNLEPPSNSPPDLPRIHKFGKILLKLYISRRTEKENRTDNLK